MLHVPNEKRKKIKNFLWMYFRNATPFKIIQIELMFMDL